MRRIGIFGIAVLFVMASGMGGPAFAQQIPVDTAPMPDLAEDDDQGNYRIGPGDSLSVFVWRNPEISANVSVRPDGMISTPLVEDMVAVGKTPTQLARDMEQVLAKYIKSPTVNIIISNFKGTPADMIRVVGQAQNPKSLQYREGMTVLDVMIDVGGLGDFAAGNKARLVRKVDGQRQEIRLRLKDLINKGDIDQNIPVQPGDVIIIPESFF